MYMYIWLNYFQLYPDLTHNGDFYGNGCQPETKQQNIAYLKMQTKLT